MKQSKVAYSKEVGKAKQELFKEAFKRVDRAIKLGFHLEAITIIESIICDNFETIISIKKDQKIFPGTLGPLVKEIMALNVAPIDLLHDLDEWRRHRNQILHQIVKITNMESVNWKARYKFAREVAIDGRELIKRVQKLVQKVKRESSL